MEETNKTRSEIRNQINSWNQKFPIDYWWRKKYNIPFGSDAHRNANLLDMFYDYEEEKTMNNLIRKIHEEELSADISPELSAGKKMSVKELDEAFDNLDVSQFNTAK